MKIKKWINVALILLLLSASIIYTPSASAEEVRTMDDESIYDLLIDRFFNGSGVNDEDADAKDALAFNGGDFAGLVAKKAFIIDMGYTIVSIGNVFETEKYDGSMVTSYKNLESHFGTEEELVKVIDTYKKNDMKIMIDFAISNVSTNHEWFANGANKDWILSEKEGKVQLDLSNQKVQEALKEALSSFISKYDVSIRLTNIDQADTKFLNELIAIVKKQRENAYVIANGESDANFDAKYDTTMIETQRNIFKTVDQDSSSIVKHANSTPPTQTLFDSPWSDRFILYGELENMYPPTRAKMAVLSALLLPGVPVIQYGTEIAMNGEAGSAAHQLYNFKTDAELIDQIANIQELRNSSETLRKGDFEVVKNEDGFIAFTRKSKNEKWLVVINNSSKTKKVVLTEDMIGSDQKISAMLETETIRSDKNGEYAVILDREIIEIYQIEEDTGINKSYLIALALVYILFMIFVIAIVRKGRKQRAMEKNENNE